MMQQASDDLHFYSLKSISKLNFDYKNFQNDFRITKDFRNSKWNQQIFKNGTMDLLNNLIKMVVFKEKISPFDNTFGY